VKSPAYYASLSRVARLQRIGEILAKGIFLLEQARQAEARKEQQAQAEMASVSASQSEAQPGSSEDASGPSPENGTVTSQESQTPGQQIVSFLTEIGEASPQEIQLKHGLSRSKTYRLLTKLQQDGKVVKTGSTRAIRYRLAA